MTDPNSDPIGEVEARKFSLYQKENIAPITNPPTISVAVAA
jgi:hypothetical protein